MAIQDIKDQVASLIDQAFELGKSSVAGISQEQLDAAVLAAKEGAKSAVIALVEAEDLDLKAKIQAL